MKRGDKPLCLERRENSNWGGGESSVQQDLGGLKLGARGSGKNGVI